MISAAVECLGYEICTEPAGNWIAVIGGFVAIWLLWRYVP